MKAHFEEMAAYNAWANGRLYDAAGSLPDDAYRRDLGAAFGSVHGTLNHLMVADTLWMTRFRDEPVPDWSVDQTLFDALADGRARRAALDLDIQGYAASLGDGDLDGALTFRSAVLGRAVTLPMVTALVHFFNHQTHHRGQCHALLTRLSGAAPPMDLLFFHMEPGQ